MSYFTEMKIVDKTSGDYAGVNVDNELQVVQTKDVNTIIKGVDFVSGNKGINSSSGVLMVVGLKEAYTYDGICFSAFTTENISSGEVKDILISTPANTTHARGVVTAKTLDSKCKVELYTGATTSADGTELTSHNNDGTSSTVSTTKVYDAPTITATGALVYSETLEAGASIKEILRVLKENTKYLLRITETGGASTDINWGFEWCEWANAN